jgi:ribose transport system substrate-binding protein
MPAPSERVGAEIVGYRIRELLGRGGMGVVYLADHIALDRPVALKVLAPEFAEDEHFRARFLSESRVAASIEHPHMVPIYDAGEADGLLYIAMRYVEGPDLRTVIRGEGALDIGRAIEIISQVAGALDAAHERGLVHRDVKSRNVLIEQGSGHCYLSDFGLVKTAASDTSVTSRDHLLGTIDYMAPEQIEGRPVDARSDVYSLGCLLYECLTGDVPFKRDSEVAALYAHLVEEPVPPTSVRHELPVGFDGVVSKAMAKRPAARFRSCGELANAAVSASAGGGHGRRRLRHGIRSRRHVLAVAAAVALASAIALIAALGSWGSDEKASTRVAFIGATPGSGRGLKLGYISLGDALPFVHLVSRSVRQQANIAGAQLLFCDSNFTPSKAVSCAKWFKHEHADGYLNFDNSEHASPAICAAGPAVPVIAIDIHQDPCERSFMGANNSYAGYIAGRALGEYFKRRFECRYDAFISLESPGTGSANEERMGGYRRGFGSVCGTISHFTKLSIDRGFGAIRRELAHALASLPRQHRIVVVSINDDSLLIALAAAKRLGRSGDLYVSGQGGSSNAWCEILNDSHWISDTAYFPERYGEIGIPYLIRLIRHEPVPQLLYVPHVVLTTNNLRRYYQPTGC